MIHPNLGVRAVLLDLDGVLSVEDEAVPGSAEAVAALRGLGLSLRFVTNTTSRSRARTLEKLERLGFGVSDPDLVTPAAPAVRHCRERGHRRVALLMNDEVKADFAGLEDAEGSADAVIIGDLGTAFCYEVLNRAFRLVMDGAELVALQKNRYWLTADGLSLDVGPFVAAIEYATRRKAFVVGSPLRVSLSWCCAISAWRRRTRRWSGTRSRQTWAAPSGPGSPPSSCGPGNTALTRWRPRASSQPPQWARSPRSPPTPRRSRERGPGPSATARCEMNHVGGKRCHQHRGTLDG